MSKTKFTYPNKNLNVSQEHLDLFFMFMFERQEIFYKRFILKIPPPWTEDPYLSNRKFTNVYRELDRNTAWYLENISDNSSIQFSLLTVAQTFIFRLINYPDTFEQVGLLDDISNWKEYKEKLRSEMSKMKQSFTSAYFIKPVSGKSRIDGYLDDVLSPIIRDIKKLTDIICNSTPEKMVEEFMKYNCIGDFVAYELYCDFVHTGLTGYGFDDYVNVGPGCKHGLSFIFPSIGQGWDYKEMNESIYRLRDSANYHFTRLNLDFKYIHEEKMLNLRVIEHSLCEFSKYINMLNNEGRLRAHYKPKSIDYSDWYTNWVTKNINIYSNV